MGQPSEMWTGRPVAGAEFTSDCVSGRRKASKGCSSTGSAPQISVNEALYDQTSLATWTDPRRAVSLDGPKQV